MTRFDQILRDANAWLAQLDHERDLVTGFLHREGPKPHLLEWIDALERERARHCELMDQLHALERENYPALLLSARPMVKASLKGARLKSRAS